MHIAIVRTEFIKRRGGAERYAVELARLWLSQGHQLTVVCHKHDAQDADGMEVVNVSRPKALGPFKHGWFAKRAGKAAGEVGADAVLCLARAYPGDVLRLGDGLHHMWLEARYGSEGAVKRAKLNPRHRELLKLEEKLFQPGRFGLYVANSEMIRDEVIARFQVDPERIRVIPNGVDWTRFHPGVRDGSIELRKQHGIPADAKLVMFSGMDFRRKGLDNAVGGFIEMAKQRRDAHFVCVGPGYTQNAEAELEAAGLRERAHFVGQTDDIAQWYGAADLFVLPSMHDPSANAVTEALACGTPVITSRENGAKQHIQGGVNGWVLEDRKDLSEIAWRMNQLIESPPTPERATDSAALISKDVNAARLLEALEQARGLNRNDQ